MNASGCELHRAGEFVLHATTRAAVQPGRARSAVLEPARTTTMGNRPTRPGGGAAPRAWLGPCGAETTERAREALEVRGVVALVGKPGSGKRASLERIVPAGEVVFDAELSASERREIISQGEIAEHLLSLAGRPLVVAASPSAAFDRGTIRRLLWMARAGRIRLAILAQDDQELPDEIAAAERFDISPFDRARAATVFDHRFGVPPFGPTLDHLLARTNCTYRVFCDLVDAMARRGAFLELNGFLVARRIDLADGALDLSSRYDWWRPGPEAPAGAADLVDLVALTGGADSIDIMEIFGVRAVKYLLRRGTLRMSRSERRVLPSSALHGQTLAASLSLSRKFELYSSYGQKLVRSCSDPTTAFSMWQWMTQLGRQPASGIAAIAANRASATGADFRDSSDKNATWKIAKAFRAAEEDGLESALKYAREASVEPANGPARYLRSILSSGDYLGAERYADDGTELPPDFVGHQSLVDALDLFRNGSVTEAATIVRTLNLKRMSLRPLLLTAFMRLQFAHLSMDQRLADQAVQLIGSAVGWDRATNSVAHFAAALNDIEQGKVNSAAVGASIFLDSIRSDTRHLLRAPAEAIQSVGLGQPLRSPGLGSSPAIHSAVDLCVGLHRLAGLRALRSEFDEPPVRRGIADQLGATSPERDPFLYINVAITGAALGVEVQLDVAERALNAIDSVGFVTLWRRVLTAYGLGQIGPIVEAADELNTRGCCLESLRMARIARHLLRQRGALSASDRERRSVTALATPAWLAPAPPAGPESPRQLTARETEIVEMIQEGLADAKIAALLGLSVRTVHAHVRNILSKLGASNRREAVRIWVRRRR